MTPPTHRPPVPDDPPPSSVATVAAPATHRIHAPVLVAAILAVFAGALTANVIAGNGMTRMDGGLLDWVIAHRNGTLTPVAVVVSDLGDTTMMAVLAVAACVWLRRFREAVLVVAVTIGAAVAVSVGKQLVGRARPPAIDHLVVETNQSYPSGHTLGCTAVVGVVTVVLLTQVHRPWYRRLIVAAAVGFVVAVGLSRLYLGVHWPTDVLAGWAIGALWLMVCLAVHRSGARRAGHARRAPSTSTSRAAVSRG